MSTQLTAHFTLEELTHSDVAVRKGIDNTPSDDIIQNLRLLAGYLEDVREKLGHPMYISSGYRCPKLNSAIGGSEHSSHMEGLAADFVCPSFGTPQEIVKYLSESGAVFDQLIFEGTWVHYGVGDSMRHEVLTAHFESGKATYTMGV